MDMGEVRPETHDEAYLNEIKIGNLLTRSGPHKNIVPILKQGWLEKGMRYYFDMERCPLTLTEFIRHDFRSVPELKHQYFRLEAAEGDMGNLNMWRILVDITNGLDFLHGLCVVHRDLKPDNGTTHWFYHIDHSAFVIATQRLANLRLRAHSARCL